MTADPASDLRSLGEFPEDDRVRPIAAGLSSQRPAANMVRTNSFYYETDTGIMYFSNGVSWGAFAPFSGIASGTSFPTSPAPVSGQPFTLTVDATNGIFWNFSYQSGISDSYKWAFSGGAPLSAVVTTAEGTTSTSFTDLATAGPSVTVPKAGVYRVDMGATMDNSTNDSDTQTGIYYNATSPTPSEGIEMEGVATGGSGQRIAQARTTIITVTSASTTVKLQYRVLSGTGTWRNRWLIVTPIRLI